ncbi:zonular occludens toxin domain-containing protein [Vitreoscilla massiliensis]|uniref:Zonular occludens toxin domain-containing protein n=1 Tax=Vitreoscilla massiliensis TaxID=1689272 RepID=A0ABY4E3G9_9NEIS|nr:zonular occludens toxin domain-containing protein [Vitreoscilla massiliensis]UOO89824.1 zonular occludens toxin domain-containing protein [Vitreoscilla massiliensis]
MIILMTGNMGTGKTSKVIQMIIDNEDKLAEMPVYDTDGKTILDWIKRPIYTAHIDGIDEVKLGVCSVTHEHMRSDTLENLFPVGSLIIVDECHYVYPVRPSSRPAPDYIAKLTELRHQGHTLIIMTQHPANIDSYVRNLVSRHIHLARKQATTRLYEWNECMTSFSPMVLKDATSRLYRPPKKAFDYYKSSSVHVKHKRRISPMVYVLLGCIISIAFIIYRFSGKNEPEQAISVAPQTELDVQMASDVLPNATQPNMATTSSGANNDTPQAGQSLKPTDFVPTIPEKPESKPLYDGIRQPKTFEQVKGVMISKGKCTAYSQQGTVVNVSDVFCKKWAKEGLPFDPYRDPTPPIQQGQQQAQQQNNANVLSLTDSTTKDTMRPSVKLDAQ